MTKTDAEYAALVLPFSERTEKPFSGSLKKYLETHADPLLNHLIASEMNWDAWEDRLPDLIASPHTNVSTHAMLYWLSQPEFHLKAESDGRAAGKVHALLREKLATADTKDALFAFEPPLHSLGDELRDKLPAAARVKLEGRNVDSSKVLDALPKKASAADIDVSAIVPELQAVQAMEKKPARRVVCEALGFSFALPKGWKVLDRAGKAAPSEKFDGIVTHNLTVEDVERRVFKYKKSEARLVVIPLGDWKFEPLARSNHSKTPAHNIYDFLLNGRRCIGVFEKYSNGAEVSWYFEHDDRALRFKLSADPAKLSDELASFVAALTTLQTKS